MQKTQLEFLGYGAYRSQNVYVGWFVHIRGFSFKSDYICLGLGITNFISRGIQAVSKFESVVNQIQKNERDIESKLQSMVMANLLKFPVSDKSNDLPGRTNRSIYLLDIIIIF